MSRGATALPAGVLALALTLALPAVGLSEGGPQVAAGEPADMQGPILQAQSGAHGWWATEVGAETCVSNRSGDRTSCWQAGGVLSDLREVTGGWVGAGRLRNAEDGDLFVVREDGNGVRSLPLPAGATAPRGRPLLVTDDTRLLGLVWLEGSSQAELEVRAAEWLGTRWGQPMIVSPPGRGSQVAPAVTVLSDGRWLLVWTAFDGSDDETVWSVFDRGRWSRPELVHDNNEAPDILPTLVTTRRGAIAAWSWLDGRDYRLRTAFFDGRSWRVDGPSGGRGSLEARFFAVAGTYLLSFETVVPEVWATWEFDEAGRVTARTAIERDEGSRPMVDVLGNGVAFRRPESGTMRVIEAPWKSEP